MLEPCFEPCKDIPRMPKGTPRASQDPRTRAQEGPKRQPKKAQGRQKRRQGHQKGDPRRQKSVSQSVSRKGARRDTLLAIPPMPLPHGPHHPPINPTGGDTHWGVIIIIMNENDDYDCLIIIFIFINYHCYSIIITIIVKF